MYKLSMFRTNITARTIRTHVLHTLMVNIIICKNIQQFLYYYFDKNLVLEV